MLPLALVVLLETRSAALDARLAIAAQASPRPSECRAAPGARDGLWLRLRDADAQRYCELLARGYGRLAETPDDALRAAAEAEQLAGSRPAVLALRGRALLGLGQPALAYASLRAAEEADPRAFVDVKALHDYARAASLAPAPTEAVRLYRLLVSRILLLDDARERVYCRIEAAAHVLSLTDGGSDEALGYLGEARQQPLGLAIWIDALRALALRQGGRMELHEGTRAAAPSGARTASFQSGMPLLPPGVFDAMQATLSDRRGLLSTAKPKGVVR